MSRIRIRFSDINYRHASDILRNHESCRRVRDPRLGSAYRVRVALQAGARNVANYSLVEAKRSRKVRWHRKCPELGAVTLIVFHTTTSKILVCLTATFLLLSL